MPRAKKHAPAVVQLNLTSMLDVVFQLIIFFLLVTNFASAELPPLEPPDPLESKALLIPERKKITVNLMPRPGREGKSDGTGIPLAVKVGVDQIDPSEYGRLTAMLKHEVASNSEVQIDLRVDRTIQYRYVEPVMKAITAAGIAHINLVASVDDASVTIQ